MPEDIATQEIVGSLCNVNREIARLKWKVGISDNGIAKMEGLTRSKVRTRVHWIKEVIADKVLM